MSIFHFKHFSIRQSNSALKVGTDAMLLGSLINSNSKKHGLDIGAGTGVLSLMVAQQNPEILIDAVEIDEGSVVDCTFNFESSEWKDRLNSIKGDFLELFFDKKYDLIFSNPPFYSDSLPNRDDRTARTKHSIHLPFEKLFEKVKSLLTVDGELWIIIPHDSEEQILKIAKENDLFPIVKIEIEGKPQKSTRTILSFKKTAEQTVRKKLLVREENGAYSDAYISLTAGFHGVKLG